MESSVVGVLQSVSGVDSDLSGGVTSSVVGSVVADSQGLCLGVQGVGDPSTAGLFSSLAGQAALLEPDHPEKPVLVLETDTQQYIVKKEQTVTVAIIKTLQ